MRKYICTLVLLFLSASLAAQDKDSLNLFETDSTWIKEIIKFPIGFAQEIKFDGFEDLRFPTGWSKEESPAFWSYTWAWSLNHTSPLSEAALEENIQYYFDGLLGIGPESNTAGSIPKTNAVFIHQKTTNLIDFYIGKVHTFDSRYTNKPMTLHVRANQRYCELSKKTIVVFRFSPKPFEHEIWSHLESVQLIGTPCE